MHTIKKLKYLTLTAFISCMCFSVLAQPVKNLKIVQADYLEGVENRQGSLKKLIGNVILEHEGALMYCDSAYHFESQNYFEAYSNVRITQGNDFTLRGGFLHYNLESKIAEVDQNVVLSDKEMTLRSPHLTYNMNTEVSYYKQGAKIVDSANTLTSKKGYYHSKQHEMFFQQDVVFVNPDFVMKTDSLKYNTATKVATYLGPTDIESEDTRVYCEKGWYNTTSRKAVFRQNAHVFNSSQKIYGDKLFYDDNTGNAHAEGKVRIIELKDKTEIAGNLSYHDEASNTTWITDSALFVKYMDTDTLFMHADTLKMLKPDSGDIILAYYDVKLFSTDFQLTCDSLAYQTQDSSFLLYADPVLWFDSSQISGAFIKIYTRNQEIDRMEVEAQAFMIEMVDTFRFNQVKGIDMTAAFKDNELNTIFFEGNAESLYYLLDDDKKFIGRNNIQSSSIQMKMKDNKMNEIRFELEPEGSVLPAETMDDKDPYLKDFRWRLAEKPMKMQDIFTHKNKAVSSGQKQKEE
jgi:lipopolysaccharide export system protein LptA